MKVHVTGFLTEVSSNWKIFPSKLPPETCLSEEGSAWRSLQNETKTSNSAFMNGGNPSRIQDKVTWTSWAVLVKRSINIYRVVADTFLA